MSTSAKGKGSDRPPLPLADLLRDLALIRASNIDLSKVAQEPYESSKDPTEDTAVQRSYSFVHEARAVLKIQNKRDIAVVGEALDRNREGFEEVLKGLDATA